MQPSDIAKILKSNGQPMTLIQVTGGSYDPVAGLNTGATAKNYTVYGVVVSYGSVARLASQNMPNSLIQTGDKKAIIQAGAVVPAVGDTLTITGKQWVIVAIDPLAPAGTDLLYKCQVRL